MPKIVGIRFKEAGKIYYFEPRDIDLKYGQHAVVETSRGVEIGKCVIEQREITEDELKHPLKSIIRRATQQDMEVYLENKERSVRAAQICEQKIESHGLDMKLVNTEYTYDRGKIIFSFTADGRVDFRELVKDLAAEFRTRIELRQIGVRDEAKIVKGLGPCGRELCCGTFLEDFSAVSIKMAKDQNMSLNPVKISGLCNRLMCCLNYEHETYVQISETMPNLDDIVQTPMGCGKVVGRNIIGEQVTVRHFVEGDRGELMEDLEKFKNCQVNCRCPYRNGGKNRKGAGSTSPTGPTSSATKTPSPTGPTGSTGSTGPAGPARSTSPASEILGAD